MRNTSRNDLPHKVLCMLFFTFFAISFSYDSTAQDEKLYLDIVKELSSARYQGRGYARDGVIKAGKYIAGQFRKAGVSEVVMQPFKIDINTFPGRMEMSVDGKRMVPGDDFTLREFSIGVKGEYTLYYIDTLDYDAGRVLADMQKPENKRAFVVVDFWFMYRHSKELKGLEKKEGCNNAGVIYTWDTPLKFYKAYGEKVSEKPILWGGPAFPRNAKTIKLNIENKFLEGYESSNVIAKVPGERHDSCYVFTAHYDHLGNLGRRLYFPGANDNASGTAAIITLTKYYAQNKPKFDIYFIAFSGEDANLRGSGFFVEHPTMPLESIRYLFNLDMVGDNNPVQYCEVSDEGAAGLAVMQSINGEKHYFEVLDRGTLAANSDHWPFAQKNVPCIMFENENGDAFPFYHTAYDDMEHFQKSTYAPLFKLITDFIQLQDNNPDK